MTKKYFASLAMLFSILMHQMSTTRLFHHITVLIWIFWRQKKIYTKFVTDHTHQSEARATASGIVESLYKNDLHGVLPVFNRVAGILAAIPVTSCSAERSFSGLRRMKTYLRSTTGQTRLNSLALLNIERKYANMAVGENVENIINIFGAKKDRTKYFFWVTFPLSILAVYC